MQIDWSMRDYWADWNPEYYVWDLLGRVPASLEAIPEAICAL